MGNVLAATESPTTSMSGGVKMPGMPGVPLPMPVPVPTPGTGIIPGPPLTAESSKDESSGEATSSESANTNPGTFDELHRKTKEVFPSNWEGAKLLINKALSNHFQISHTLNMSSLTGSGYKFGATYVGSQHYGPNESFPVLIGEMDPSGDLNANIIHQPLANMRLKIVGQIQKSKFAATQVSSDMLGKDFSASVTLGNPDIINDSGVLAVQYLQRITRGLSLGAEIIYQKGAQIPGGQFAIMSFGGKYVGAGWQASGQVGGAGIHCCYHMKCSEQIQCGVEVETSARLMDSTATLGYQIDLPKANLLFRGMVDSNWLVGGVLEKRLQPLPFTLALSGMINHAKNQSRFGIGLIIG